MSAASLSSPALSSPTRARRQRLDRLAPRGTGRRSGALLLGETIAAIGFAAGLAGAISSVAGGQTLPLGWAMLAIASALARGGLATLSARLGSVEAGRAKARLRHDVVATILQRRSGVGASGGELVNAAVDEVEAIDGYIARFLPARLAASIAPMLVLAAAAVASPVSAAILALTLVPFIAALALAGGAAADESRRQFAALARLSAVFADQVRALPVILAFNARTREQQRLATASTEVADRTMHVLRIAFVSSGALEFFSALSVALVAVYAGFNLLGLLPFPVPEQLTLARAFFVLALAPEFYAPMRRLAAAYHDRQAADTAVDRLAALATPGTAPAATPFTRSGTPPSILFRDVTIRYPDSDRAAVSGFNLHIEPGETIALMGASGIGKTSILNCLIGLVPLSDGHIEVDGVPLPAPRNIAPIVAWSGQSPLILPGSILQNIALARPDAPPHEVEAALQAAGLGAMLSGRGDGVHSILDERGGGLSGGERRRIGIARAILKRAPVLLLDEPTAHLDAQAEADMIVTLHAASRGATTLIATHSPALAAIADRVIML